MFKRLVRHIPYAVVIVCLDELNTQLRIKLKTKIITCKRTIDFRFLIYLMNKPYFKPLLNSALKQM